jgi:hypothetical protein
LQDSTASLKVVTNISVIGASKPLMLRERPAASPPFTTIMPMSATDNTAVASRPEAAVQADRLRLPSSCGIVLKRELTAKRASAIRPCPEHEAVADLA